jgi:hypothetical protein
MKIKEILTELIGIKNKVKDLPTNPKLDAWKTGYPLGVEWHDVMTNNGFTPLGKGNFGTVWEHPNLPYVLKVFSDTDVAYINWVAVAQQNKNNPHMPKFISPRLMRIVPGVVAIRTERLTRIDKDTYRMLKPPLDVMVEEATINRTSASEIIESELWKLLKFNSFMAYCKAYPEFVPALDLVIKSIMQPGYRPDLHDDNIMMRGPIIVFTDPVFEKSSLMRRL